MGEGSIVLLHSQIAAGFFSQDFLTKIFYFYVKRNPAKKKKISQILRENSFFVMFFVRYMLLFCVYGRSCAQISSLGSILLPSSRSRDPTKKISRKKSCEKTHASILPCNRTYIGEGDSGQNHVVILKYAFYF